MARGVRGAVNYDAQIQKLDEKIERYTNLLSGLKAQKQELLTKKQENDMHDLYTYMQENGLSAADVIAQLEPVDVVAASGNATEEECV